MKILNKDKNMKIKERIKQGYVLEVGISDECRRLSYEELTDLGYICLAEDWKNVDGEGLDKAYFSSNGIIYSGEMIELEKGDYVIVIKNQLKK